jgi:hypothetical protein
MPLLVAGYRDTLLVSWAFGSGTVRFPQIWVSNLHGTSRHNLFIEIDGDKGNPVASLRSAYAGHAERLSYFWPNDVPIDIGRRSPAFPVTPPFYYPQVSWVSRQVPASR